jgi:hypothetical protein
MVHSHAIDLRNAPDRIKMLPRDHRGYPVPWFVHWETANQPDFRIIGAGKVEQAIALNLCWICGGQVARNKAFVIGPMCSINRVSAEPPSHPSCALFAATTCPFLTKPRMRRNEKDLPEHQSAPGHMVLHNPGVACVWVTREFRLLPVDNGLLFRIGEPVDVRWLCQGQPATRGEVIRSIEKGLPILMNEAKEESDDAVQALLQAVARMRQYLPGVGNAEGPGATQAKVSPSPQGRTRAA